MSQPNLLELAKQGDANAIATLMNRKLQPKGITAKASMKNNCLQIMLSAAQVPPQETLVALIRKSMASLGAENIDRVKVFGKKTGEEFPDWIEEFELAEKVNLSSPTIEINPEIENSNSIVKVETDNQLAVQEESNPISFWGSISKIAKNAGGAIADSASGAGKVVVEKATGVGGAIAGATIQAGKTAIEKVPEVGSAIANSASHAGKFVVKKTTDAVAPIVDATGKKIEDIKKIGTDWLIRIIDKVDIVKAETEVRELEKKYPDQKPDRIAHHLMVNKALLAAGSGLASNFLPGSALAMAGVDMAATTALSAELVYQIAAAYGQDLQSSDRKGEVLTIFGLSLGGNLAIDAGLGLIEKIPIAGAVINASASAAMIYALGYGACRFYEAKNTPLNMEATLVDVEVESQKYLEGAIAQEVVMDQILVHIILAGNPGKTWSDIQPELQAANLAPASLEAISNNINSPPPLESLLAKINHDFAVPLLAQCQKIAQLDGVVTPEEAKVIETISKKFDLDMAFVTN